MLIMCFSIKYVNHVFQHKIYIHTNNASFANKYNSYQNTLHNFRINRGYSPMTQLIIQKYALYHDQYNISLNKNKLSMQFFFRLHSFYINYEKNEIYICNYHLFMEQDFTCLTSELEFPNVYSNHLWYCLTTSNMINRA